MFGYLYNLLLRCSYCDLSTIPSWKALVFILFMEGVIIIVAQCTRKILYLRFNESEIRPFVDLVHHAEIALIIQSQILFLSLSSVDIAWRIFFLTAVLYYQMESQCYPAESNPIFGIVKSSLRHFKCNVDDSSDPEKRQNVVTQRLISWTALFIFLTYVYAKVFHNFALHFLKDEIEGDALELRFCCVMNNDFFWLYSLLEMLGIYFAIRLNNCVCPGSSFIGESIVRAILLATFAVFGLPVYYMFLNPLTVVLPFVICEYSTSFIIHLIATTLATVLSIKVVDTFEQQRKSSEFSEKYTNARAEELSFSGNNSAQGGDVNDRPRDLLCTIFSLTNDEINDEQLIGGYESFMESRSFSASLWLKDWFNKKLETFSDKISNFHKSNVKPNIELTRKHGPIKCLVSQNMNQRNEETSAKNSIRNYQVIARHSSTSTAQEGSNEDNTGDSSSDISIPNNSFKSRKFNNYKTELLDQAKMSTCKNHSNSKQRDYCKKRSFK